MNDEFVVDETGKKKKTLAQIAQEWIDQIGEQNWLSQMEKSEAAIQGGFIVTKHTTDKGDKVTTKISSSPSGLVTTNQQVDIKTVTGEIVTTSFATLDYTGKSPVTAARAGSFEAVCAYGIQETTKKIIEDIRSGKAVEDITIDENHDLT
ncbi:MAG: hypothetical protein WCJ33_06225, partial [Pseudomonadota bacterium]